MAKAASVEGRVPFLDVRFVEMAMGIAASQKVQHNQEKYLLKKAFEGILPQNILHRPKDGFTIPLTHLLTNDLLAEGVARELVNRIQNMRKNNNYNVTDRINISLQESEYITPAIALFGGYIQQETLADSLTLAETVEQGTLIELDAVSLMLYLERNAN